MNGILLVDKPAGFTSFDVIAKMRGMSRQRKIGHAGTLDPMATGVLPLFFGTATKACDIMPCQDKRYRARFRLGEETDTQDTTGTVLSRRPVTAGAEEVAAALGRFRGNIMQLPPMYSAVQVNGRRLYDIARAGGTVEREQRAVTIRSLELTETDDASHTYEIDVACSKGTYVRTLCHDLGQALGCGAVLAGLRRTEAAGFSLESCVTLDQVQQLCDSGGLESCLLPVERLFETLPHVELDARRSALFCNGVRLDLARNQIPTIEGPYAVYQAGEHRFLGIAHNDYERGELHMDKLFAER